MMTLTPAAPSLLQTFACPLHRGSTPPSRGNVPTGTAFTEPLAPELPGPEPIEPDAFEPEIAKPEPIEPEPPEPEPGEPEPLRAPVLTAPWALEPLPLPAGALSRPPQAAMAKLTNAGKDHHPWVSMNRAATYRAYCRTEASAWLVVVYVTKFLGPRGVCRGMPDQDTTVAPRSRLAEQWPPRRAWHEDCPLRSRSSGRDGADRARRDPPRGTRLSSDAGRTSASRRSIYAAPLSRLSPSLQAPGGSGRGQMFGSTRRFNRAADSLTGSTRVGRVVVVRRLVDPAAIGTRHGPRGRAGRNVLTETAGTPKRDVLGPSIRIVLVVALHRVGEGHLCRDGIPTQRRFAHDTRARHSWA
jgi:hypothetical protein